jgi:hypothetical protein
METLTFVFTDLEASTRLSWRADDCRPRPASGTSANTV